MLSQNTVVDWLNIGEVVDPASYSMSHDVLSEVSALFSESFQVSSPGPSLSYLTEAGDFTFSAMLGSTSLGTCTLTTVDFITGFLWVFPEPTQATILQGSTETAVVKVASGQVMSLVVKLLRGTDATVSWTFNGGSTQISTSLDSSCPASITPVPESCGYSSSFLSSPYASIQHTFTPGTNPVSLTIHASNAVSFTEMRVTFQVYAPITNVEFYHQDCQTYSNCDVYVEEGLLQEFFVRAAGDIEDIVYYKDGNMISPSPTAIANHSMTFSNDDDVVLSVNVSNSVSWMIMDLTVHARIRANLGPVSFDTVLDKVALGDVVQISATASVSSGAYVSITWIIGDANSTYEQTRSNTQVTPRIPAHIFKTTGNVSVTVLLEDRFGDSVSATMVVEVYKVPDTIILDSSLTDIATGEQFELSIRVDNCSSPQEYHYGQLSYSVDWGNVGSTVWTDSSPIQSLTHQLDTAGSYTVSVSVSPENDPSITRTATLVLNLQDAITGLRLNYDGPKHVSDQITFTASVNSGTDVRYTLEYGDGASSLEQTSESFSYRYTVADVYKAVVRAQNAVSQGTFSLTLYAYDETLVQIIKVRAPHCSPVNKTVTVSTEVAAQLPGSLDYTWNFGNGDIQTAVGLNSASSVYSSIGNFFISLEVENVTGSISDNYIAEICIEESIMGLTIQYHTPVALVMPGAVEYVEFVASVQSGSNMTYEWTVNGIDDDANYDLLNLTITQAGTYNITVRVVNDLDSIQQDFHLVAMEVISGLSINCLNCSREYYCISNSNTSFQAIKDYGTHENYTWTLSNGFPPQGGDFFEYHFLNAGNYTLDLISMNEVSTVRESAVIFVQDQITGFSVTVSQSTAIVDTSVTFQGVYSTGSSLKFHWVCDQSSVGNSVSDFVSLSFATEGFHNCSVMVYNEVSATEQSFQITVLGQVSNISVNHSLVPSQSNPTQWYAVLAQAYTFEALVNTDFLITYNWDIIQHGSLLQTYSSSGFTYSFASPGSFNISLLVDNSLISDEAFLTVTAQEPVSGLNINTSAQVYTILGAWIPFEASINSGSDITYTWTVNGTAQQGDASTVNIEFSSTGIFVVKVTAANNLGQETVESVVNVFEPVSGIVIQLSHTQWLPFISLTSDLDMAVPNASGSDLTYQWTITNSTGDSVLSSNFKSLLYSFASAGQYTIHVLVSNPVSSLDDRVSIEVQGAIEKAQIDTSQVMVATGSSSVFSADVNAGATNLSYTWKIDGAQVANTETFTHQFQATGTYQVSLRVENNISSSENETTIRVLDPVSNLQILDCAVRLAQSLSNFNSSVDSGTNLTYVWSVTNDSTSESFSGQNISYTFADQGVFNVSLVASNDLGSSMTYCTVEAHFPIGNVSVNITDPNPDYIFTGQKVTFTVSGGNLQLADFTWNITGEPVSVSTTNIHIVTLGTTGPHDLVVVITNGVSESRLALSFTVKDFSCSLPLVRQVGADHRSVLRSHALELEVTVDPQGCTDYIAVHSWKVYQAPDCNADFTALPQVGLHS